MKIEQQTPVVIGVDSQGQRASVLRESSSVKSRRADQAQAKTLAQPRPLGKGTSFNLQLNQQLSSMQSAESYLDQLGARLQQLKLSLSREVGSAQQAERETIKGVVRELEQLLDEREKRSAGSLDSSLRLRLHEPARSRFTIQGLESLEQVRHAGKETLVFSAARQLAEPVAVILDEGLSAEQVLRRFNSSLGQAGIRADLDANGVLKFSMRESEWGELRGHLVLQGEGKLAAKAPSKARTEDEQLLSFPETIGSDSHRELRRVLDNVVSALDRVNSVREQITQRQQEIREFLAKYSLDNESEWASHYVTQVFNQLQRQPQSYAAVTQTVVAQANLTRYSVVGLLL